MCVPQSQTSNPFQKSTTKTNTCVSWPASSAAECALNWKDCENRAAVMSFFFNRPNLL
ncbi:hypothetical protein DPMN_058763 [Dreissena polymorpha]|uniref:Uncharacterized protein n=1 Tax=Dreissena polymorpha TaxID=45954 RepID=A0A9D4C2Q1_DREPO|nr:hypothetical protein DPMN_058763 [Dreissena polymorpha]